MEINVYTYVQFSNFSKYGENSIKGTVVGLRKRYNGKNVGELKKILHDLTKRFLLFLSVFIGIYFVRSLETATVQAVPPNRNELKT